MVNFLYLSRFHGIAQRTCWPLEGCRGSGGDSDGDGHASAILPSPSPAYPPYRNNPIDQRNPPKRNTSGQNSITVAYIEFAKAFDTVSHVKLCRLQYYSIDGCLLGRVACIATVQSLNVSSKLEVVENRAELY